VAVSTRVAEDDGTPSSRMSGRVWVIDDSPLQGEISRKALCPYYEVVVYSSGAAMLEALAASTAPDILVLDWHMPDMSGVEVCRFVREARDLAQLPILILTTSGSSESLLEGLAAGANDFVRKPVSELELNARVAGLVRMASLHAKLTEAERKLRIEADFRERFMGMLAHDLRQPLNTIFMASGALASKVLAANKSAGMLSMQLRAAERMKRMITELLDFTRSRPESGMPIQPQWTDLAALARASLEEIGSAQTQHQLSLSVDGPCLGNWDPDRMSQVCGNLVGNAIEYSAPGSPIEVRLSCNELGVELQVSNRGDVIPPEVLPTLFQPFRRGRESKRSNDGVGLGLYIVEQIVVAHGGTISVQSEDGYTHFRVWLPR
jgi:signal transduction histidine kinase